MSITRTGGHLHNPLHIAAVCATGVLALVMLVDPLFPPAPAPLANAVGGYEAVNVLGPSDFTSSSGDLLDTRSMAYDSVSGRLFVADTSNHRVAVYSISGGIVDGQDPVNVLGQANLNDVDCNRGGTLDINTLCDPEGVTYDAASQLLFVADDINNRVMVFDVASITDGEDAVNVLGQPDFTTGTAATTQAKMSAPVGVTYDAANDRLFVAESNSHRVLMFDLSGGPSDGMLAAHVLGQGDFTSAVEATTQGGMRNPMGVAVDESGSRLFVADFSNRRVTVFDVTSITDGEDAVNVLGQPDFTSSDLAVTQTGMGSPAGVGYDSLNDRLFVSDYTNNRVLLFSVASTTDGEAAIDVIGQPDFTSSDSATTASGLFAPFHLQFDTDNSRLFVADSNNSRILVFDLEPAAAVGGHEATEVFGQPDFETADPLAGDTGMTAPFAVAVDTLHNRMFVSDFQNSRVLVFNVEAPPTISDHTADFVLGQPDFTTTASATTATGMSFPTDVSYDGVNNRLFVADQGNGRILVFDVASITSGEAAINVIGQPNFTASGGGTSQTEFNSPQAISVEPLNGILAVADVANHRIMIFDISGGITDGMAASRVLGQVDFDSADPGLAADALNSPVAVLAETYTDSLWVGDQENNRVLQFDLFAASGDPALHVVGQPDFTTNSADVTANKINRPNRVALRESDTQPLLYVAENNNDRIMVFDVTAVTDGEDAVDVYGASDFTSTGEGTSATTFRDPNGMDYDEETATLYVADIQNHRVLLFGPVPTVDDDTPPPSGIEFAPRSIQVNQDESVTDSRNVLVTVWATNNERFTGTVDVLLSNDPMFSTFIPFRYNIPGPGGEQDIWPKTIAWDLCFGQSEGDPCDPGTKTVYARFYVNVPLPSQVLTP